VAVAFAVSAGLIACFALFAVTGLRSAESPVKTPRRRRRRAPKQRAAAPTA
jgi:hypothetical protein